MFKKLVFGVFSSLLAAAPVNAQDEWFDMFIEELRPQVLDAVIEEAKTSILNCMIPVSVLSVPEFRLAMEYEYRSTGLYTETMTTLRQTALEEYNQDLDADAKFLSGKPVLQHDAFARWYEDFSTSAEADFERYLKTQDWEKIHRLTLDCDATIGLQ